MFQVKKSVLFSFANGFQSSWPSIFPYCCGEVRPQALLRTQSVDSTSGRIGQLWESRSKSQLNSPTDTWASAFIYRPYYNKTSVLIIVNRCHHNHTLCLRYNLQSGGNKERVKMNKIDMSCSKPNNSVNIMSNCEVFTFYITLNNIIYVLYFKGHHLLHHKAKYRSRFPRISQTANPLWNQLCSIPHHALHASFLNPRGSLCLWR